MGVGVLMFGRSQAMRVFALLVGVACSIGVFLVVVTPSGDASGSRDPRGALQGRRQAPVALQLGSGRRGAVKWAIWAFRGQGPRGAVRPCIEEFDQVYRGITSGTDCGSLAPPAAEPARTEFSASLPAGKRAVRVSITVIGMTFARRVHKVRLKMNSGPDVIRTPELLSRRRAAIARVRPFRYLAFALGREACVEAITAFDARGNEVLATRPEACQPG